MALIGMRLPDHLRRNRPEATGIRVGRNRFVAAPGQVGHDLSDVDLTRPDDVGGTVPRSSMITWTRAGYVVQRGRHPLRRRGPMPSAPFGSVVDRSTITGKMHDLLAVFLLDPLAASMRPSTISGGRFVRNQSIPLWSYADYRPSAGPATAAAGRGQKRRLDARWEAPQQRFQAGPV